MESRDAPSPYQVYWLVRAFSVAGTEHTSASPFVVSELYV